MQPFVSLPARDEYTVAQFDGGSMLIAESHYPPALRIGRHAHRGATITAVLRGALDEGYGATADTCDAATIVVRPPGAPHRDDIGNRGVRNLEIDLHSDDVSRGFDSLRHVRDERANEIARRLSIELRIDDAARTIAVEGTALELVAVLIRLAGAPRLKPPAWLARAHELVHDRFRDPLTISELAAEAGVHPVHFARSFREHYGVAPAALVRRLRIRWAADRVRTTSDSLATIAAEAGFYDQPHFARVFRAIVGVSPSHFRALGQS
ncbi:MAG: helix-turn-helix transcriptional regulator [Thermoanaerobaculia bacterium]